MLNTDALPEAGTGLDTYTDDELLAQIGRATDDLRAYLEEAVRRGLSQSRIAAAMGVSQKTVSRRMQALDIAPTRPTVQPPRVVRTTTRPEAEDEEDEWDEIEGRFDEWLDEIISDGPHRGRKRRDVVEEAARLAAERKAERERVEEQIKRATQFAGPSAEAVAAAEKATKLLAKGLSADAPEGDAFIAKVRELVRIHKLEVIGLRPL